MRFGSVVAIAVLLLSACGASDTASASSPGAPGSPAAPATAAPAPAAEPAPASSDPTLRAPCSALPETFSDATRIRLTQHDYDRPEAMQRWDLVAADRECPADELPAHLGLARPQCVHVPAPELEALYVALRAHGLARFRVRPAAPTAHRGGHAIDVSWPTGACHVAVVSGESQIAREDAPAFGEAVTAIADVIRDALE
jgi:hypothetical protein